MKKIMLWLTVAFISVMLVGCSSDSAKTMTPNKVSNSNTVFTIQWDSASRGIIAPSNVMSIVVEIFHDGSDVPIDKQTTNRPIAIPPNVLPTLSTIIFFGLPNEQLTFSVKSYDQPNGSGNLMSSSKQTFTPEIGLSELNLAMHTVPASLSANPQQITFDVTDVMPKPVIISGLDNKYNQIFFQKDELKFTILDENIATIVPITDSITPIYNQKQILPKNVGQTTLRVESTVPGSSASVEIPITVTSVTFDSVSIYPVTPLTLTGGSVSISSTIKGTVPVKVEAIISGGNLLIPERVVFGAPEGDYYFANWQAPPNASNNGIANVYTVKIVATTSQYKNYEKTVGTVTVNAAEVPPPIY